MFLTLLPLRVKYCGAASFVQVDAKKLRLSCEIFHKLYLLNSKLLDWRRGAGYIPSSFCLSPVLPVLAVVEDLSKAVAESVRSLATVFINEPEFDVSISQPLQAGVTAASTNYSCIQGTAT